MPTDEEKRALEIKQMLADFEREKQRIVETYQKEVIARQNEINDLNVKIADLEGIFKAAFGAKIEELERRFKELEADQAVLVGRQNEHTAKEQAFALSQADHERLIDDDLARISKLRDEADSLMNDARGQSGHIKDDISRNAAILEEIKSERRAFESSRQTYADEKARIEQDLSAATANKARAGDILREAERMQSEAQAIKANAAQQLADLTAKEEDVRKFLKECDDAIVMVAARKLEVDALMEESKI